MLFFLLFWTRKLEMKESVGLVYRQNYNRIDTPTTTGTSNYLSVHTYSGTETAKFIANEV